MLICTPSNGHSVSHKFSQMRFYAIFCYFAISSQIFAILKIKEFRPTISTVYIIKIANILSRIPSMNQREKLRIIYHKITRNTYLQLFEEISANLIISLVVNSSNCHGNGHWHFDDIRFSSISQRPFKDVSHRNASSISLTFHS